MNVHSVAGIAQGTYFNVTFLFAGELANNFDWLAWLLWLLMLVAPWDENFSNSSLLTPRFLLRRHFHSRSVDSGWLAMDLRDELAPLVHARSRHHTGSLVLARGCLRSFDFSALLDFCYCNSISPRCFLPNTVQVL